MIMLQIGKLVNLNKYVWSDKPSERELRYNDSRQIFGSSERVLGRKVTVVGLVVSASGIKIENRFKLGLVYQVFSTGGSP